MAETTGYREVIHAGLWKKITHYQILHLWFAAWCALLVFQAIACFRWFGFRWFLLSLIPSAVEFVLLQWFTTFDIHWDEIRIAQWVRKYVPYYDA